MPPAAPRVKILVSDATRRMKRAVSRRAREQNRSRNDVVAEVIAKRFSMVHEESGVEYRPGPDPASGPWSIEVPENLRRKLRVEAARRGGTISGLVRETLAEEFGLPAESVKRRPRSK